MKMQLINIADKSNYNKKDWSNEGFLIFSDEWELRKKQCQNFIKSRNQIHDRKIHGRKCRVTEISDVLGKEFLEEHHIQGANNLGVVFFGLFYEDELVGVMSLGRHSRQIAENRIVLDRFCIAYGLHIPGGSTKLFSRCVEWAKKHKYDEIISFSDNRWTDGNIYKVLGFSLEKNHKPDYCYVDTKNPTRRLSKQSQKKSSTKCPEGMTELEWADLRGLKRLWDRGKKRWVYLLDSEAMLWKEKLSAKCAAQNQRGDFKHSHIRGYFRSEKCKAEVYYGSSYELRCMYLLENDPQVRSYRRADVFIDRDGRSRNPDLHVEHIDDTVEILEIKPESRFQKEDAVQKQIEETTVYAAQNGYQFSVWSEKDSGLDNDKAIINWAKKHIAETTGNTDWIEKQLANNRKKSKKYYHKHIAQDKVEVFCKFCNETHTPLRLTYEKNIERNGEYICEKHGGHLAGKKPGKKKVNPYAAEGKKQCNRCKDIKLFEEFGEDKSKSDGFATRCKKCRAEVATERYQKKKSSP